MPARVSGAVTLRDIAARVGVTTAAVSMALSGNSRISEQTRTRVRAAADELGYVPSSAARALRRQRAGAVAVIVPNTTHHVFGHMYFQHVLTGVSSVANDHDTHMLVATNADHEGGITAYERVLRSRSADGAIVTSAAIDDPDVRRLATSGIPVVLLGAFPELPDSPSVWIDDVAAARNATEHLIQVHGRRRLAHVTGPLDHRTGVDRLAGFLEAVEAAGMSADATVVEGDFSESSGAAAIERLLAAETDGAFFANDDMAFGALVALRARGVDVPGRMSVVGVDDFGLARLTTPALSTMHVPAEQLAADAAEVLFAMIDGGLAAEITPRRAELVVRESCGCGVA